jgi:hypothetical protein
MVVPLGPHSVQFRGSKAFEIAFFKNMAMEGNMTWDNFVFHDVNNPVESAHRTRKFLLLPLVFED